MTFDDFQATREPVKGGQAYLDGDFIIEDVRPDPQDYDSEPFYVLHIDNGWVQSDDLTELERELYEHVFGTDDECR